MKIYNFIDFTNNTNAITADFQIAYKRLSVKTQEGHNCQLWEGELKTQGKNFQSWVSGWKKIELPF